jgi:adenosylmethionine-8-amino-7-oxononanoate aminotransferase
MVPLLSKWLSEALQFFFNKGEKYNTIAFENAFHGDTFAAMAASGIFYTQAFEECLLMSFVFLHPKGKSKKVMMHYERK